MKVPKHTILHFNLSKTHQWR